MSWLNKQWSKLDFWDKEENERQKQQFAKPTPQTKPAVPQSVDWRTKNAKFGVLANNPQRQKSFLNDIAMPNQAVTNARNIASGIVEAPVKIGKTLGKGFWETGDAAKQLPGALLGKNNGFKESLDQSIIGGVGRFGQSLASAGLSPVTNSLADRERKRSERLLIPAYENLYRASGADPRLGRNQAEQEALGADYTIRTDPLNRSNIGVNDSLGTTARKVTAQAGEAILDTATAPAMGLATGKAIVSSPTKQFLKSTLDSGLLSGGGNLLYTAQQDNVTPLDYAKSGGLGFATGIALPVGTRLVKEMPRFVDQNIPRTAFRETELGKRATWVTPNRKLAEQFKRPETVAEAYTYRKKDILDPSDNRTRSRLIERYGENKINNLTSDTLNGRFNDQLEAPARKIAKEMGYKGAAFDEPILPSDPRSLRRNPLSINVFDQSALKSKQLLNEGGYINPSEILDSTKRAVKQLKNNGSGKAMSVEKPVDLKAEVKAPKVPRGNIEEQVVKGENTPLETAPVKSIGQLQATSRLPKDKKLRELETVKKQIIDAETESIMATKPERNLIKETLRHGGISSSAYETLPKGVKRKTGFSADELAQEMGFTDEDAYIEALQNYATHQNRKLTKTQAREMAIERLESGKSDYSGDLQEILKEIETRNLELDQLGATKITPNKPSQKMTEAEFNSLLDTAEAQNPNLKTKKAVEIATKPKREQQLKAVMEGDLETSNKLRQEIAEVKDGTLKSAPDMNKVFDNEDLGKVELKDIKGRANKQTKQKFMTRVNEYLGEKQAGRFRATDSARTFNEQFGDLTDAQKLQVIEGADNPELRTTDDRVNQAIDALHKEYDTAYRYYTKDKNINMGYQSSYYPRMYKNPATGEAIDSATFQLLQKASSRQKGRTADQIATDFLITKDPAEALQKYHASLESAAAGKKFLQDLQKDGLVMQSTEPVRGMQPIVAEGMQDAGTIYYAKPEVAKSLNKMFGNQEASGLFENLMEKGAGLNSFVQSFVLSGGVPNTPLNAFGVMQVMKHTMAGHPIQAAKAFHKGMSRGGADKFFRANSDAMQQLAKQGYTIRVDYDPAYKSGRKQIAEAFKDSKAKGLNEGWDQFTNDATFKRFMPAMEILHFKGVRDGLIKRGVPQEQAIKQAADATGNFFGKTKVATEATRSKVGSDAAGALLFAPRFRESMINFWGRNIKALNPKNIGKVEYRDNQKFLVAAAITYATMEGLNKSLTGEWMHDNPDGKKDKLLIPADKLKAVGIDTKGKDIGTPFLPSIATVPRNAVSGIYNLATGNTKEAGKNLQSFLSMPVKTASELLTNENYFGRQIVDEDATTPEKLSQAASHIVSSNMQPWIREGLNMAGQNLPDGAKKALGIKQKSGVETASNALELPFRFYDPNYYKKGDEYINRQGKNASVKRDGKYVKVSDLPLGQRFQESLKNLGESGDSDYIKRNVAEIDSEMNKIYQKYGLPPAKTSTAVAKKWAEYDNRLKDGKISPLKQPAEERKLLRDTYKLQTQGATRDFLSVSSDNDMRQAIKDGLVDKKTLKSAIELDNFLVANGLQSSPTIGKKLRTELGYNTPGDKKGSKKSVASGGGNKKIIDDMIKAMLASSEGKSKLNKNLRTLIEGLSKKEYAKAKKVTV